MASATRVEGNGTAAATARAIGDQPITQLVERGDVVQVVQEFRAEHTVDLVVTASPDLADRLAGAGVLPILAMPPEAVPGVGGSVLVAIDGSDLDERVVETTARVFSESTTFVVLHVAPDGLASTAGPLATARALPSIGMPVASEPGGLRAAIRDAEAVASRAAAEVGVTRAVAVGGVGDPVAEILAAADEHGASLIVLGRHDRGLLSHLIRPSVADAVLQRSNRPVMVIATSARPDEDVSSGRRD